MLELAKNQANAKQNPEVELLLLFTFFSHNITQNIRTHSKKYEREQACLYLQN